jgi:hypothetical protein
MAPEDGNHVAEHDDLVGQIDVVTLLQPKDLRVRMAR